MGAPGSIYEGYTLSWGDEFNSLDIVGPATPKAKWFPTRAYLPGARGSDTLLGTMYDGDPLHTGHNDSNRGVPVGYDTLRQSGSAVTLQARRATLAEQAHMAPTGAGVNGGVRTEIAATMHGAGAVAWMPAASGGTIVYEARIRYSQNNPPSWHPDFWLTTLGLSVNTNEWGFEGNGNGSYLVEVDWTGGTGAGADFGGTYAYDGQYHTLTFVLGNGVGGVKFYIDGVLWATATNRDAETKGKPQAPILTSHVYNGVWHGLGYASADWANDADGAQFDVDWMRVWRATGRGHFKPAAAISDLNLAFGENGTLTLPSKAALWGDETVIEYVQIIPFEENEPFGSHTVGFTQFPSGVTYDAATRTMSVAFAADTGGKAGRLHAAVYAYKDGATCEPARFSINRGPRIAVDTIAATSGQALSFDLYGACDVGRITPKTIAVSGLPAGFSFSSATGLITGQSATVGNNTFQVTLANAIGQSVTKTVGLNVGAAAVSSFSTNFSTAGNLEGLPGFTRVSGSATGIQAASGVCKFNDATAGGTMVLTPQLAAGTHFIEAKFRNNASGGIAVRATDNLNCFVFRRGTNPSGGAAQGQVLRIVNGAVTQIATLTDAITATDVIRFVDLGSTLGVYKNGVAMTVGTGSLSTSGGPPASTREGLIARSAVVNDALDDLATGIVT